MLISTFNTFLSVPQIHIRIAFKYFNLLRCKSIIYLGSSLKVKAEDGEKNKGTFIELISIVKHLTNSRKSRLQQRLIKHIFLYIRLNKYFVCQMVAFIPIYNFVHYLMIYLTFSIQFVICEYFMHIPENNSSIFLHSRNLHLAWLLCVPYGSCARTSGKDIFLSKFDSPEYPIIIKIPLSLISFI